jgi:hypothetical protein
MADDPEKPYGNDVEYADPGLREDGKSRYALDSEAHCKAAWEHVTQDDNAAKYMADQLKTVKGRIRAALKRYGVEVEASAAEPEPPPDPQPEHPETEAPAMPGASSCPAPLTAAEATETTAPTAEEKGAGLMDPAKIREGLGLAPDASDDEVRAALVTAGLAPPAADLSGQQLDQRVAANATRNGLITIDPEQLQQYKDAMVQAAGLAKRLAAQERDTAIDKAVADGKFPPSRRQNYEKAWDADPDGTRELIASLAVGLVPVTAMGYSTDAAEDTLWDSEYARLFPKEASRG